VVDTRIVVVVTTVFQHCVMASAVVYSNSVSCCKSNGLVTLASTKLHMDGITLARLSSGYWISARYSF